MASLASMARVDAVLYNIQADGTLGNSTILKFSSTEHEPNTYYVYIADTLSFYVSSFIESRDFAAKLSVYLCFLKWPLLSTRIVLHEDFILMEPLLPGISVKTRTWSVEESEPTFVKIPIPDLSKNQCIRYFLHPNDSFKIGQLHLTLQARPTALNQEVQVTSSRPDEIDGVVQKQDVQDLSPLSKTRPATPIPGLGAAVMETPMTDRHQVPLHAAERSMTRSPSPTPTKPLEMSDKPPNGNQIMARDSPLEGSPKSQESERSLREGCAHSGDRNKSSSIQPSQTDEIRESRKRSASYNNKSDCHNTATPTIIDLESAPRIDDLNEEDAPRKRQKRSGRSKAAREGVDESQNSVRSTIHVEVPDMDKEHGEAKADGNPNTCSNCNRTFLKATALAQHLKRAKGCAKPPSSLNGEEPEKDKSLTPLADPQTHLAPEDKQAPGSPEPRPSGENTNSTPPGHPDLTEPPSSNRSTRLTGQGRRGQDLSQNQITRVYYTSSTKVEESTIYTKFLRQHSIKPVKSVAECDILCTGKGELKRTSNLILAILMGKEVVTDQWVIQSAQKHKVLDTAEFIPESAAREREWGTSLSAAIERGRQELKPLEGWTISFTPSIKKELGKSWTELKEVCLAAGAAVQAVIPRKSPAETDSTVVVAASYEPDLSTLEERGWKVFTKDIITYSVLRGRIDTSSDEFLMPPTKKGNAGGKRKR
ncbi:MAG: hypothetical protein Q9216_001561 [Gyalolechia sp. 2 TL-2023]